MAHFPEVGRVTRPLCQTRLCIVHSVHECDPDAVAAGCGIPAALGNAQVPYWK